MPLTHSLHTPWGSPLSPAPSYVEGSPRPWPQLWGAGPALCPTESGIAGPARSVWPQPRPRPSMPARACPDRHRKDTSCVPACWPQQEQAASELPTGSGSEPWQRTQLASEGEKGHLLSGTRAARGRGCEPAGVRGWMVSSPETRPSPGPWPRVGDLLWK